MENTKAVDLVNLELAMSENNKKLKDYVDAIEIPTKVSELTNDSGYLTGFTETDPTVPAWAKAASKPNYTASEVGADAAGTASATTSTHNSATDAHSDIRLLIEGLATRLNAALNSTDTDLDQMAEIVAYIKSNKSLIDTITTSKVSVSDIINNLTTNATDKPLSAAQGVVLKGLIDGLATVATSGSYNDLTDKPTIPSAYSHPTHTAQNSGLYKITVNSLGHVSAVSAVVKSDITGLGIPAQDTTYSVVSTTAAGLAPKRDGSTTKFLRADGTWAVPPDTDTKYTHPSYTAKASGLYKVTVDETGHVSAASAVTKSDITGLGIPAQDTTYSVATTSAAGLLSADDKTKLDGIASGANKYTHPTSAGNKHIPSGGSTGQILRWSASGTAVWGAETDTTYSTMGAASSSAAGTAGLVPAPAAGKQTAFLRGDGTWVVPTNTTYAAATTSTAGLLSAADKTKLDGIATGANKYSLPTASSTLGGVKTTSTVTSTDGLTACPIIEGVPYYKDTNTTYYIPVPTCTTAAATAAKAVNHSYYNLDANRLFMIMFRYANTAASALTLNVASNGAKPLYINGAASSSTNYTIPVGVYMVYYDGTNYHIRTDGYLPGPATAAYSLTNTLDVSKGGTGATTFTSGAALIGAGTGAVTTRAITNNTATSTSIPASTNLITANTLRYAINRTSSVAAANTSYTTLMARGTRLASTATSPGVNGAICWTYS